MTDAPIDLTDVPESDLVDEVMRRHNGVALVYVDRRVEEGEILEAEPQVCFSDGRYQAIGLMQHAIAQLCAPSYQLDIGMDEEDDPD